VVSLFFAGGESKSVPARELDDRRENKEMPQFCPAAERMGMQMTRKQKYRRVLLALAALFLILAVLLGYDAMRESLPDTMYVDENSESPFQPLTKHPLLTISEDTKEAEKNEFGETGETVVECSAAGIPLKKIRVIQEERPKVAVCGAPVGIYMETDGVMVIRTAEIRSSDGTVSRPSENILREGDYITNIVYKFVFLEGDQMIALHKVTDWHTLIYKTCCSKSIKRFPGVSFPASGRGNDRGAGDTAEKPGRHLPPRGLGPRQYAGNRNTDFRGTGWNLCSARPWNQ